MSLNIRRTGDANYGRYIKALIAGPPGSGKTLISSTFPNPFYASAEGGLMSIADRQIPYAEITSSTDLLAVKTMMDQDPITREKLLGFPVDTIVIDTIDEIQRLLIRERLDEQKKEAMQLQDWGWIGEQMSSIVRGFRNLSMNVIFTVHVKEQQDGDTGRVWIEPGLQGAIAKQIPGAVDLALFLKSTTVAAVENGQAVRKFVRLLVTQPDVQHDWIKDRSGKLPPEFVVNFEDDYKRMAELIYGGLEDLSAQEDVVSNVETVLSGMIDSREPVPTVGTEGVVITPAKTTINEQDPGPAPLRVVEEMVSVVSNGPEFPVAAPTVVEEVPVVAAGDVLTCVECGIEVDRDRADLSKIRTRKILCLEDMRAYLKK